MVSFGFRTGIAWMDEALDKADAADDAGDKKGAMRVLIAAAKDIAVPPEAEQAKRDAIAEAQRELEAMQ